MNKKMSKKVAPKQPERSPSQVPQYTIQKVSDMTNITVYALRYYDKLGLFPFLKRGENNNRLFSEFDLGWVRIVHCLRCTGLPLVDVKHYVDLCLVGDDTIDERAEMIFRQEKTLRANIAALQEQLKVLQNKKTYYEALLENRQLYDSCNPAKR
ncbi:MAG: MerR family transcriptional regulator [Thermoguttaceae bacterium]